MYIRDRSKDGILRYIGNLEKQIKKYENKIIALEESIYLTMKKPINEVKYSDVTRKWNNKTRTISQEYKGIRRLKRNIYRFTKEIEYIKVHYLQNN